MTKLLQEQKVNEARVILAAIGMPSKQQNRRTALVLLAMCNLAPDQEWSEVSANTLGISKCMDWMADHYPDIRKGKEDPTRYKPNSRESIRKYSVRQLVSAGVLIQNSDDPGRSTNDQNNRYHPSDLALKTLATFGTSDWDAALTEFHDVCGSLSEKWAAERERREVPLVMPGIDSAETLRLSMSPGDHSELIQAVAYRFGPQFTPGGTVVYLGDTGDKWIINKSEYLKKLGVTVNPHGKMPDVVIHYTEKNWLVLVEAVTSTGPVDGQRLGDLKELFQGAEPGLVFVTAFQTKTKFRSFAADIAWETEVWVEEDDTHMIHFNGERFLGPYPDALG
ncbi:BsuBI/PstI family type II restriction endonuclease [Streptomyces sp. NPDC098781]|uniref:BsuBI/PstI family type II restriction endonuclease n=1 Tax=Streptomyces sp. NPDC098781 TaxID=3366097 RepID=UPI0038070CA5